MSLGTELDYIRDLPGYKAILKAVLRSQIQLLVYQLAEHTGAESILLSANVTEGTLSHIGSEAGKNFLSDHIEVKKLFLGHCLDTYKKQKTEAAKSSSSKENKSLKRLHLSSPRTEPYPLPRKRSYRADRRSLRFSDGTKLYVCKSGEQMGTLETLSNNVTTNESVFPLTSVQPSLENDDNRSLLHISNDQYSKTIKTESDTDERPDNDQQLDETIIIKREPVDYDLEGSSNQYTVENVPQQQPDLTKITPVHLAKSHPLRNSNSLEQKSADTIENGCKLIRQLLASGPSLSSADDLQELQNQSGECVLKPDQQLVTNKLLCEHPDEGSQLAIQIHSKRKKTVPMRITKQSPDSWNSVNNVNSILFMQSMDLATEKSVNQESSRYNSDSDDFEYALKGQEQKSTDLELCISGHSNFPSWKQERVHDVFRKSFEDQESQGQGSPSGQESALGYCSADEVKKLAKYMKTPQVDGMLVTRGEGRYEKLIRCDTCGKVCRTSNMARHKKRYCSDSVPVAAQQKKGKVSVAGHDDLKGNNSPGLRSGTEENEMPDVTANNVTFETLAETIDVKQEVPSDDEWIIADKMT